MACNLPKATSRGRYFMPQSGATMTSAALMYGNARRMRAATSSGVSTSLVERSMTPRMIFLFGKVSKHRAVEIRLRGLDRHLAQRALGEFRQERVARRPRMNDCRVAETDVHGGRAGDALERAVERLQAKLARLLRPRLHVGLVDLHDVGAGVEQVADLGVDRGRVIHRRELAAAAVEVDLRLLRHREGSGHRDLDAALRVPAQELQVADLDRVAAPDRAHDARHRIGMTAAIERRAGIVEIDAVERGGEAVGVALAPDLAVGDDVEAGASSCALIAMMVASSWASARNASGTRHSSRARTRGGNRPASFLRSISHSGCG